MVVDLTIVLAVVTLLALFVYPVAGVALLFICKPIVDANWNHLVFLDLPLTQIMSGLVPLAVIFHMLLSKPDEGLGRMPLKGIWLAYTVYLSFAAWLILFNQDLRSGSNVLFRHLNGLVGFYMVQAWFHNEKRIKLLLVALILGGLFPIGVGAYQLATGTVWRLEGQTIEGIVRTVGLYHDAITIRHYSFQTILALLLFVALSPYQSLLVKAGLLFYVAVATVVMAKAYSKAGLLLLVLWGSCWSLLQKKLITFAVLIAGGLCLSLYLASDYLAQALTIYQKEIGYLSGKTEAVRTLNGRWYIWQDMYAEWSKLDGFAKTFGSGKVGLGAHNDYVQILFHGGIVGLFIYVTLLASVGRQILLNLWRRIDPLSVGALMVLLSWMVDTIGLVPSAYSGYQWFVWGIIGLSLRMRAEEQHDAARQLEPLPAPDDHRVHAVTRTHPPQALASRRFPLLSG